MQLLYHFLSSFLKNSDKWRVSYCTVKYCPDCPCYYYRITQFFQGKVLGNYETCTRPVKLGTTKKNQFETNFTCRAACSQSPKSVDKDQSVAKK